RRMNIYTLKINDTFMLFTNFPNGYEDDEFVVDLLGKTKKKLNILYAVSIVLSFLVLLDYDWKMLLYYNLIIAYLVIANIIEYNAMKKIRQYKKDNNISTENSILTYDLKTSRDIEKKKIRLIAWIIPLIVQIVLLVAFFKNSEMFFLYVLLLVAMSASTILTGWFLGRKNTKVYSTDSDENLKLNEESIIKVQQTMYAIYIMFIVLGFVVVYYSSKDVYKIFPIFSYIVLHTLAIILVIFKYQNKEKNLTAINNDLYNGDFFDPWGYYNPKDDRLMVEDISIKNGNITFNRAKLSGKILYALTAVLLIAIEFMMINLSLPKTYTVDNTPTTLTITESIYTTIIDKKSIEKVELIEDINKTDGVRLNGTSLKHYSYGKFNIKNIGNCDVYIHNDNPRAIWIKTKDNKNLVFNFPTEKETEKFYKNLH
ncbi:MAG: PH domain-containing protein, partial [Finegoldia magna]|nr:PH domain-containing protein [Finegoldia magna]